MHYVYAFAKNMSRSALFWNFMRCSLLLGFGTTNQSHLKDQAVPKKKKIKLLDACHGIDTLSSNFGNRLYQSTKRKIPEDCWSFLHRGGSLKSRKKYN
jgi:hypothetical protein